MVFCVMRISDAHDSESERKYDISATDLRYFRLVPSALPCVRAECGLRHLWLGCASSPNSYLHIYLRCLEPTAEWRDVVHRCTAAPAATSLRSRFLESPPLEDGRVTCENPWSSGLFPPHWAARHPTSSCAPASRPSLSAPAGSAAHAPLGCSDPGRAMRIGRWSTSANAPSSSASVPRHAVSST